MKPTSQTRKSRIKNPPSYFRSRGRPLKSPMKTDCAIGTSKPSPRGRPAPVSSGEEQSHLKNQKLVKVRAIEIPAEFTTSPVAARFWHPAVEMRPVKELRRSKRNARTHSKKQRDKLMSAVQRFGFVNPLIVDEQGHSRRPSSPRGRV